MTGRLVSFIRDANWLDRERISGYAKILLVTWAGFLVVGHMQTLRQGTDLLAFWSAAHFVLGGKPSAVYDAAALTAHQSALGFPGSHPFLNPPPFLALVAPLGLLAYPAALILWIVAGYAALAVAIRWLPRTAYWPVLAFPGGLLSAMAGQNGLLTTALIAGSVGLLPKRKLAAGVMMGLLVIKPQLALLAPFAFAAGREWRAFAAAAVTAVVGLGLSIAVLGWDTMQAFLVGSDFTASLFGRPELLPKIKSVFGLAIQLGGPVSLAAAAQFLAVAFAVWAVWRVWSQSDDPLERAAILGAATPLSTPYLLLYDIGFLALPIAWLAMLAIRRGFAPWERLALVAIYFLPLLALEYSSLPIVPLMSLGLALAVLRGRRSLTAVAAEA
jgi:hypothetical protein